MSCPSELNPHPSMTGRCVAKCPTGYEYRTVDGVAKCVYKAKPEYTVSLTALETMGATPRGMPVPPGSFEQIKTSKPGLYAQYTNEIKRFNDELAIVNGKIDKDTKVAGAFKTLQDAENARDQAPDAYQAARMAYYTLVKGSGWAEEEKARIAKAEVDPVVNAYTTRYNDVKARMDQQTRTMDIVTSVKDKLLSVQDDFGKTVGAFSKQLSAVKNQINMERKQSVAKVSGIWKWVNRGVNILLVIALLFSIVAVMRVVYAKWGTGAKPGVKPSAPAPKPAVGTQTSKQ